MFRRIVRAGAVGALAVLLLAVSTLGGCYGSFTLTRSLYDWNGEIGDDVVKNLVFWVMLIIPVYELAGAVDFLALNVIEFWTGENPAASNAPIDGIEALADGSVRVRRGATLYTLVPEGPGRVGIVVDGEQRGLFEWDAIGGAALIGVEGARAARLSAARLGALKRQAAQLAP